MSQQPEEILSIFSKSEELLKMLQRGRTFTEELMRENERLRYRMIQIETDNMDLRDEYKTNLDTLRGQNDSVRQKLQFLERRFLDVESENKDFAQRYTEVEEQNESLANLYVASYRLHSTLDPHEVVECIKEILINMVGSEEFGLYVVDEETGDLALTGYEGEIAKRTEKGGVAFGEGLEGFVAQSGQPFFTEDAGEGGEVCACLPLMIKERVVGVIAIYKLLPHKRGLTELDHRLLDLLAGQAATALVSSRLYAQTDRKLRTIEGVMSLLRER